MWFEDSELVILDEATSAMDNLTEENVMKSVMQKMKDKTVIAIAHRLNSIAGFDRIILFKEGRIVGIECIILLMIQRYLFWKQLNQFGGIK